MSLKKGSLASRKVRGQLSNGSLRAEVCGRAFTVSLGEPTGRRPSEPVTLVSEWVECLRCSHRWFYRGGARRRVECPRCGSTKNEFNRRRFGAWQGDLQ